MLTRGVGVAKRYWWATLLLLGAVAYAVVKIRSPGFVEGFMGNWLATALGLLVGIPIALELERRTNRAEAQRRQSKVLTLLQQELTHNHDILQRLWLGGSPTDRGLFIGAALKRDVWNAFSDGGELQWIDDAELIDTIASAYYWLGMIERISEKLYDSEFMTGDVNRRTTTQRLNSRGDVIGGTTEVTIEAACDAIEAARANLPDYNAPTREPIPF